MLRLNPWDDYISDRIDLQQEFEISAMNIFANWFWKYEPWSTTRTFFNDHFLRRFNPAPSFYLAHPKRGSLERYHSFEPLMNFVNQKKFVSSIVVGTTKPSHLKEIVQWLGDSQKEDN
jgi:hypothetical protein